MSRNVKNIHDELQALISQVQRAKDLIKESEKKARDLEAAIQAVKSKQIKHADIKRKRQGLDG